MIYIIAWILVGLMSTLGILVISIYKDRFNKHVILTLLNLSLVLGPLIIILAWWVFKLPREAGSHDPT